VTGPTVLERDYDELPAARNRRKPELRPSDVTNLAGQETGRHTLSHTRISVWLACHRKFELGYLKRLELARRPRYFTLGSAFQKAIEYQDPEVGVRLLNGFEPCPDCKDGLEVTERTLLMGELCLTCDGRRYIGEQIVFHYADDEREHLINEAIVRGASKLYLKKWPGGTGETREVEYRVRLRSPWTGAYSNTYDLLGYADGVIDPLKMTNTAWGALPDPDRPDDRGPLETDDRPLEVIENKLVGRIEPAQVQSLPLDRQLALERYGLWRATGRPVTRVWYRYIKKPSIQQRAGRKKDRSDAESLPEFLERIEADYADRPEFYAHEEDPSFVTARDLLRIEADLWEVADQIRAQARLGGDGRRRAFDRNTSHCREYGGCAFIPICKGDPDALALYNVRPKRATSEVKIESAPEAE
jgi:hypothetical protein